MPGYRIASKRDRCAGCRDKPSDGVPFRVCKGCRLVSFCSKSCQRESWNSHKSLCREAQSANGLNTDSSLGRETAHVHRLARDFWEAYDDAIRTYVYSKVMDHFRNNRSASFGTFDWSNHFFLLPISPRFESVEDLTDCSPAKLFHIQAGTFRSFSGLDAATILSWDLGSDNVKKMKEMMSVSPASTRIGAVGMILFLIDLGEFGRITARFPVPAELAVGAALDISSTGPSKFLILQTIVERGINLLFDQEREREVFHRMVHGRRGWKWEPLQQKEEEDLKSDEGMRRILYWFDEN